LYRWRTTPTCRNPNLLLPMSKPLPFKDFLDASARQIAFAFLKYSDEVKSTVFAVLGKGQERGMDLQKSEPWGEKALMGEDTISQMDFQSFVDEVWLDLTDGLIEGGMKNVKCRLHAWLNTAQIRGRQIQIKR
jgi:hypothetical protein